MKKTESKKPKEAEPAIEQEAPADQTPPSLHLSDLQKMAEIIKVCSRRGAFQAEEMTTVGELYNKLLHFTQNPVQKEPEKETE